MHVQGSGRDGLLYSHPLSSKATQLNTHEPLNVSHSAQHSTKADNPLYPLPSPKQNVCPLSHICHSPGARWCRWCPRSPDHHAAHRPTPSLHPPPPHHHRRRRRRRHHHHHFHQYHQNDFHHHYPPTPPFRTTNNITTIEPLPPPSPMGCGWGDAVSRKTDPKQPMLALRGKVMGPQDGKEGEWQGAGRGGGGWEQAGGGQCLGRERMPTWDCCR